MCCFLAAELLLTDVLCCAVCALSVCSVTLADFYSESRDHLGILSSSTLCSAALCCAVLFCLQVILAQSSPSTANRAPAATPASVPMKNKNIYVHCLDGRRVTGLLILLLRRLQNYSPDFSYSEFWKFQLGTNTAYQEELRMNREFDRFVNDINEEFVLPAGVLPRWVT